jgi:hypothetical protein
MAEVGIILGLTYGGVLAGGAGLALADHLHSKSAGDAADKERNKYSILNRPSDHPLKCDFRDAIGLNRYPSGIFLPFNRNDVTRASKRASVWWHPDKGHGNTDESFKSFTKMRNAFAKPEVWRQYDTQVTSELEMLRKIAEEDGDQQEPVDWKKFNLRFLASLAATKSQATDPPQSEPEASGKSGPLFQVFLDGSRSMRDRLNSTTKIERAQEVFKDVSPRFIMTPTIVHLIGNKTGDDKSRPIGGGEETPYDAHDEEALLSKWSTAANTFLWEYVHEQAAQHPGYQYQEMIIITDGVDNTSTGAFSGLDGFQELTKRMSKKIRISLLLLGKASLEIANKYRDLCIATGGIFHHETPTSKKTDVMAGFVGPLMLPDGTRDILALRLQDEYRRMLANGTAIEINGFLPLTNGEEPNLKIQAAVQAAAPASSGTSSSAATAAVRKTSSNEDKCSMQ